MDETRLLFLALAGALTSALGTIGLLVKAVVDSRSRKNGDGSMTRREFEMSIVELRGHIDMQVGHLTEQVERLEESLRDFRRISHDRWDRLNPLPGTLELLWKRLDRLENVKR